MKEHAGVLEEGVQPVAVRGHEIKHPEWTGYGEQHIEEVSKSDEDYGHCVFDQVIVRFPACCNYCNINGDQPCPEQQGAVCTCPECRDGVSHWQIHTAVDSNILILEIARYE